ncbi:hypothetical protein AB5J52_48555 (plasmid) [Streptomyces sp. R39]|uniref:Recombinase family protein n=1 Tax=Streptomyces sp. R39 TaxID=3238631 RepID=A0AB39R4V0_9ACTN
MTSALELPRLLASRVRAPGRRNAELRALREAFRRTVVEDITGPVVAALYVLVRPGQDPAPRLAGARAAAGRAGYTVAEVLVEDAWTEDPALRPRLAYALTLMQQRGIHGLVAVSRTDISCHDGLYEAELRRLRGAGGFLYLAHDEVHS